MTMFDDDENELACFRYLILEKMMDEAKDPRDIACRAMGISRKGLEAGETILKYGSPELIEAVQLGVTNNPWMVASIARSGRPWPVAWRKRYAKAKKEQGRACERAVMEGLTEPVLVSSRELSQLFACSVRMVEKLPPPVSS